LTSSLNTRCQSRFTKLLITVLIQRPGRLKSSWLLIKMGHFWGGLSGFLRVTGGGYFHFELKKKRAGGGEESSSM
jgi:hypothetical protein